MRNISKIITSARSARTSLRLPNTERPVTVTEGTNRFCKVEDVAALAASVMANKTGSKPPELYDGITAGRVVDSARCFLSGELGRNA